MDELITRAKVEARVQRTVTEEKERLKTWTEDKNGCCSRMVPMLT